MGFRMKWLVLLCGVFLIAGAAFGGDLEPAAPPGSTSSYTMHDLYERFLNGMQGSKKTFTGPEVWHGGGSGPMETVDDVMGVAPVKDDSAGATAAEVKSGKRFWGLTGGEWGPQTGTFVQPSEPAPSPETGQTGCWDGDGNSIDCANTGQDGDHLMGLPLPGPRFTDNGDGTVTDNKTGLIWLKDANCFGFRTWATALNDCNGLADGGCSGMLSDGSIAGDWRLPTIRELRSLVNYAYSNPAISNATGSGQWGPGDPFDDVRSSFYWSSTAYAYNTSFAWYVNMNFGNVSSNGKTTAGYVWPVRGGQ